MANASIPTRTMRVTGVGQSTMAIQPRLLIHATIELHERKAKRLKKQRSLRPKS